MHKVRKGPKRFKSSPPFWSPGPDFSGTFFCAIFGYPPGTTFGGFGGPKGLQKRGFGRVVFESFSKTRKPRFSRPLMRFREVPGPGFGYRSVTFRRSVSETTSWRGPGTKIGRFWTPMDTCWETTGRLFGVCVFGRLSENPRRRPAAEGVGSSWGGILTDPALSGYVCRSPRPTSVPD